MPEFETTLLLLGAAKLGAITLATVGKGLIVRMREDPERAERVLLEPEGSA